MLPLREAAELAEAHLLGQPPVSGTELALTGAERRDDGWIFYYQSLRYLETKAMADMLGGNSPVRVADDGSTSYVAVTDLL